MGSGRDLHSLLYELSLSKTICKVKSNSVDISWNVIGRSFEKSMEINLLRFTAGGLQRPRTRPSPGSVGTASDEADSLILG